MEIRSQSEYSSIKNINTVNFDRNQSGTTLQYFGEDRLLTS